ncbi:hypothetical protein D9M70_590580 [compost metagenome]
MSPFDAEGVEQSEHGAGQVAEGVVAIHALGGLAVTRHVRHEYTEVLRQGLDVARVVGQAGRTGATSMEHGQRIPLAQFVDEDLAFADGHAACGHA